MIEGSAAARPRRTARHSATQQHSKAASLRASEQGTQERRGALLTCGSSPLERSGACVQVCRCAGVHESFWNQRPKTSSTIHGKLCLMVDSTREIRRRHFPHLGSHHERGQPPQWGAVCQTNLLPLPGIAFQLSKNPTASSRPHPAKFWNDLSNFSR